MVAVMAYHESGAENYHDIETEATIGRYRI